MTMQNQSSHHPLCPVVVLLVLLACSTGCDNVRQLTAEESAGLEKIRTGQYELVKKEELTQLKTDLAQAKKDSEGVNRYQMHFRGSGTWRFDTKTGSVCLLQASPADWKRPEAQGLACP